MIGKRLNLKLIFKILFYCRLILLFISGIQSSMSSKKSALDDDFVTELKTSYEFRLQAVDHTKLLTIRTAKINKRRARLFEQMGLPIEENIIRPKKIFLSRQGKPVKNIPDKVTDNTGNYFYQSLNILM